MINTYTHSYEKLTKQCKQERNKLSGFLIIQTHPWVILCAQTHNKGKTAQVKLLL